MQTKQTEALADAPAEGATMTAVVRDAYGPPNEVLRVAQVARPTAGAGEVVLEVRAAGVDQGVWHLVTGLPYAVRLAGFGIRSPKEPGTGMDVAGVVVATGDGVTAFRPGDEVFGIGIGTYAQYARARADKLAHKPADLSFEQAAAIAISGLPALQAVRDQAEVQQGERVLVLGASGGVGTFAVQVAKAFGAEVTGVASTAKLDLVRSVGADHVIDYAAEDPTDGAVRYDVIIDIGGNRRLRDLRRALTPKGRLVITGGETEGRWLGGFDRQLRSLLFSPLISQRMRFFVAKEGGGDIEVLRDLVVQGAITPAVERTYPLEEAATALADLRARKLRGKAVITP